MMWQKGNCKHCQILRQELDTCFSILMYYHLVCAKPCTLHKNTNVTILLHLISQTE